MVRRFFSALLLCSLLLTFSHQLRAQSPTVEDTPDNPPVVPEETDEIRIFSVEFSGLNLVDSNIINSVIRSRPKSVFSLRKVSDDLKSLFELGFFDDITVKVDDADPDKLTLFFDFKEKPQILKIRFFAVNPYFNSVYESLRRQTQITPPPTTTRSPENTKVAAEAGGQRPETDATGDSENDLSAIAREKYADKADKKSVSDDEVELYGVSLGAATVSEAMLLKKYSMLDTAKLIQDVDAIREEYKKKGNFGTNITYQVTPLPDNFVILDFFVDESPRSYLTEINVTGTDFYYPIDIVRIMNSSKIDSFSWFNRSGIFHEQLINADLYLINNTYQSEGFIKAFIKRPDISYIHNPDFSKFIVDIDIDEGDRYFVGEFDITGDDNALIVPKEQLLSLIDLQKGDPFNPFKISAARSAMEQVYQSYGYAYSFATSQQTVHEDTKTVDVFFRVFRGEKAYVNRVDFKGNLSTMDYVLRRELTFFDNEIYDGQKIAESQFRLFGLGYYTQNGVQMNRNDILQRNELDYEIELNETFTGSIGGQLSYSDAQGVALGANYSESNFLGRGYLLRLNSNFTEKKQRQFSITFGNNYLFDTKIGSSTSASYDFDPRSSYYDIEEVGLSQTLSYPIWFNWRYINRLSGTHTNYSDITEEGNDRLNNQSVKLVYSYRTGFIYNTVNNPRLPSSGREFGIFIEQVGGFLGGDEEYGRFDVNYQQFIPLTDSNRTVFMLNLENSLLFQTDADKDIPTNRRLYLGGIKNVRGYDTDEIEGPSSTPEWKDGFTESDLKKTDTESTDDDYSYFIAHKGGIRRHFLNLELLFPLTREGENIRGVLFYDIGNVFAEPRMYSITNNKPDDGYFRTGYGAGVRLITPAGVIRFEYGINPAPKSGEVSGKLHFTVSTLF